MMIRKRGRGAAPLIAGAAALLSIAAAPASAAIAVQVNGSPVYFAGAQPEQVNGRVFIPLRGVAENLGAEVRWDAVNRTVFGSRDGRSFTLPLGARTAYVEGRAVALDAPAQVRGGRTVVPLRFVAEALGAEVAWQPAQRLVAIDLPTTQVAGERESRVVVPANTVVRVKLDEDLDSERARVGERFTATVDDEDRSRFPEGTKLEGRVTQVQRATKSKPGLIDMAFDRVLLPDGTTMAVNGTLSTLDEEHVQRSKDGRLVSRKKANANFDWKWVGYGAAGGAVLGEILGDGNLLKGALLGGLGGAVYSYMNRDKGKGKGDFRDVELSRGMTFGVKLNRQVAFADRESYRYP